MKTVTIQSGNLSKSAKNFTAKDAAGNRVHIPLALLTSAKLEPANIEFPFYAIVVTKTYDELAEKDTLVDGETIKAGEPTGKTFSREEAGSVFTTEDAMIAAFNASELTKIKAESQILNAKASARVAAVRSISTEGLTESQMQLLVDSAF